ncbi:endonuclease/exonuclease/phosphatase family protein [Candidatus Nitrospira nitrificans]|uniref:Endonuclease/exonuclease/phosphatase n=1 Tax=Candidatus Nitrospira nitrificans TaxID=1742973 RepID=A0A0S4LBG2_9BACT|nr:endonuclease/exonuclease/phosphatase family protein [Candidatus Nitrospira nitrificans]CUS34511.1 Endonuclease/exonuclease/phosphatase [Candidatus Nitrospira nitrificans]
MRLATFNVENLFDRSKIMNLNKWTDGSKILKDYARLTDLVGQDVYSSTDKKEMLKIMEKYPGLSSPQKKDSTYIRLRDIRGDFLKKPQGQSVQIVANGRSSWIGWFELNTEPISEVATENTARVVRLLNADILGVVEAEDRTGLKAFNDTVVKKIGGQPYDHVMLIDGNDERGIDVGIISRSKLPIVSMRSHVDDQDQEGSIFSRDCAEYTFGLSEGRTLLVLVNHLKSKGYGTQGDSDAKRLRQARQIRKIYDQRRQEGFQYIAIIGDFNDTPDSGPLAPLLKEESDLKDVAAHPNYHNDGRPGTHGNGTASSKLDYILLSPSLWATVQQAGIERRGVWGGKNGTLWPILPEIKSAKDAASDHAALWVDLAI